MKETPKDFVNHPFNSITQNNESETIAANIMRILNRTGNIFRPLSFEEYKKERMKDGNYSESEESYFDRVIRYCKNADTAKLFSPSWEDGKD